MRLLVASGVRAATREIGGVGPSLHAAVAGERAAQFGAEVPLLVETILEPTREVPVVVVTYHRSEDGSAGAESRTS